MRSITKLFNLNDPGWGRGNSGNSGGNNGNNGNGSEPPRRPDNRGDGPPDLDEVWRDFNNRLGSMFGKRKGRGGGNNPFGGGPGQGGGMPPLPKGSPKLFVGLGALAVAIWLGSGFLVVQEGQVAVVTRFGEYTKTLSPGLQWHMPYPIEESEAVNIAQLRTFEVGFRGTARNKVLSESLMLTTDENIVDIQYVVQYRLMPEGAPDYLFNTADPDESVRQAAETAMREIVGRKTMDFVLYEGRTEVATEVQQLTQEILERYRNGIQVSTVAIQNVQPPEQVQAAFDDAVKAGQDRERLINEGTAYANKILPETEGTVARMLQDAEGYLARVVGDARGNASRFTSIEAEYAKAPGVTRERLYLSTMQEILENTSKIMVDSQANSNMLYLPLDKIMNQAAGPQASATGFSGSIEGRAAAAGASSVSGQPASGSPGGSRSGSAGGNASPRAGDPATPYSGSLMSPYSR